jgi:hypothetical protein
MSFPPPIIRSFDLQFLAVTLGTLTIRGWADGDALIGEFPNDDFELISGADGEVLVIRKHNSVADITLRIAQGNPLIDQVRQLHEASLQSGTLAYPFEAVNLRGTERMAGGAVIKKRPRMAFSDSSQPVEINIGLVVSAWDGGFQVSPI